MKSNGVYGESSGAELSGLESPPFKRPLKFAPRLKPAKALQMVDKAIADDQLVAALRWCHSGIAFLEDDKTMREDESARSPDVWIGSPLMKHIRKRACTQKPC